MIAAAQTGLCPLLPSVGPGCPGISYMFCDETDPFDHLFFTRQRLHTEAAVKARLVRRAVLRGALVGHAQTSSSCTAASAPLQDPTAELAAQPHFKDF